jgi:hypothetical protein
MIVDPAAGALSRRNAMMKLILAAGAALGLAGCGAYGYGTGVSVGYNSGYGYNGYGYNGYNGYGGSNCLARDGYGRSYYVCGYDNYYGSNRYIYSPRTVVYYYPGYTYRGGYYYDRNNRRYDGRWLYNRHYGTRRRY